MTDDIIKEAQSTTTDDIIERLRAKAGRVHPNDVMDPADIEANEDYPGEQLWVALPVAVAAVREAENARDEALIAKRRSEADYVRACEQAENAAGGAMTDEPIIDALTAKAWGEDGPHRKRAVHLEVAVAALREAGAECDDLAQLLHEAIEREKALEAENARLREALRAARPAARKVIGPSEYQ